jgi:hypothetical protein
VSKVGFCQASRWQTSWLANSGMEWLVSSAGPGGMES